MMFFEREDLEKNSVVHHKNSDRSDSRLVNLELTNTKGNVNYAYEGDHKSKAPVIHKREDGSVIEAYSSAMDAFRATGIRYDLILSGKPVKKTGYEGSYFERPEYYMGDEEKRTGFGIPVAQIDILTKEVLYIWSSGKEAEKYTGIDSTDILSVSKGLIETSGGFLWRFLTLDEAPYPLSKLGDLNRLKNKRSFEKVLELNPDGSIKEEFRHINDASDKIRAGDKSITRRSIAGICHGLEKSSRYFLLESEYMRRINENEPLIQEVSLDFDYLNSEIVTMDLEGNVLQSSINALECAKSLGINFIANSIIDVSLDIIESHKFHRFAFKQLYDKNVILDPNYYKALSYNVLKKVVRRDNSLAVAPPAASVDDEPLTEERVKSMTMPELRQSLDSLGLPSTGVQIDLINRHLQYLNSVNNPTPETRKQSSFTQMQLKGMDTIELQMLLKNAKITYSKMSKEELIERVLEYGVSHDSLHKPLLSYTKEEILDMSQPELYVVLKAAGLDYLGVKEKLIERALSYKETGPIPKIKKQTSFTQSELTAMDQIQLQMLLKNAKIVYSDCNREELIRKIVDNGVSHDCLHKPLLSYTKQEVVAMSQPELHVVLKMAKLKYHGSKDVLLERAISHIDANLALIASKQPRAPVLILSGGKVEKALTPVLEVVFQPAVQPQLSSTKDIKTAILQILPSPNQISNPSFAVVSSSRPTSALIPTTVAVTPIASTLELWSREELEKKKQFQIQCILLKAKISYTGSMKTMIDRILENRLVKPPKEEDITPTGESLKNMSMIELQCVLEKYGLPKKGIQKEIVERIMNHLKPEDVAQPPARSDALPYTKSELERMNKTQVMEILKNSGTEYQGRLEVLIERVLSLGISPRGLPEISSSDGPRLVLSPNQPPTEKSNSSVPDNSDIQRKTFPTGITRYLEFSKMQQQG